MKIRGKAKKDCTGINKNFEIIRIIYPIAIQIGHGLIPLVDKGDESLLVKEILNCRKRFDEKYGFPFPLVHIADNSTLASNEYLILINGIEAARSTVRMGYHLCMDLGDVKTEQDCTSLDKTKDAAFGIDGFYVPDREVEKYIDSGYVCTKPERIISTHLSEIIKKNITNILNQELLKTILTEESKTELDAIFEESANYTISDFIDLLNYLLEEEVPIRDMNIILKTIAANIKKNFKLYELGEMVRQQLASSFIKNYTDENNVLHVIKIGKDTCKFLSYKAFYPKSKKTMPYCVLETEDLRRFYHSVLPSLQKFSQRNLIPILVCEAKIRPLLAEILHREMPWVQVISDVELSSIEKDISIKVEEEVMLDEIYKKPLKIMDMSIFKAIFKHNRFDEINSVKQGDEYIDYGIIHGNNTIVFIKVGFRGSIYGYKHKYIRIAKNLHEQYGCTVIVSSNPNGYTDYFEGEMKSIKAYAYYHHFENYQVYFMGHSAGAVIGLMHAYKYPVIKKVLLINPPLKFTKQEAINDLIKEGITNYDKGIINVVLGSKDYSVRETKSIIEEHELRLKVNVIKGADHNFKGKLKLFMELPAQIFFEKN